MSVNNYTAESIKALTDREHVRLRPAMYIASTNVQGINQLIYEIVDNSVDEFLAGFGLSIDVHVYKDCSVRIRDYARGVPCSMTKDAEGNDINSLTLIFAKLRSGGKYDNSVYQYSSGIHGVHFSIKYIYFNIKIKICRKVYNYSDINTIYKRKIK